MYNLTNMEADLFAVIFEDTLVQLSIINEYNNKLRKYKIEQDRVLLSREKYNVKLVKDNDELCANNCKQLDCDNNKLKKAVADRILCQDVISKAYVELSLDKTFRPLAEHNEAARHKNYHLVALTEDNALNLIKWRDTAKQLRVQRNRIRSALYDVDFVIDEISKEVMDAMRKNMSENRYHEKWQNSRVEQHGLHIDKNEGKLTDAITHYRNKQFDEQRIHFEIKLLTDTQEKEILETLEEVKAQYTRDVEKIDVRIERVKSNYEDCVITRGKMELKFADREAEMNSWLQFKNNREAIHLRNLKCQQAAIIVQAWWRGLLVRLNLGPYRQPTHMPVKPKKNK